MTSKNVALILSIIFIAVGLLGFIPNPIVGEGGIFHTDTLHNLVHIISGALFAIVAIASPANAPMFMKIFGVVYFLIGVVGLFSLGEDGTGMALGFLHVNSADNYLHLALGVVIFLAGTMKAPTTTTT